MTIAGTNLLGAALGAVPPLDAPPAHQVWLFESPWPLVGLLLLASVVGFIALNRQEKGRWAVGAFLLGVVAAGAVFGVAAGVKTEREALLGRTAAFVDAVAAGDVETVDELLAESLEVSFAGTLAAEVNRELVLGVVGAFQEGGALELREYLSGSRQAEVRGAGFGVSQLKITVVAARGGAGSTWWRLDWRKQPDGAWRITELECLLINGRPPAGEVAAAMRRFGSG